MEHRQRGLPRGFGPVRSERGHAGRKRRVANLGAGEDPLDVPSAKAVLQLLCFKHIYIYIYLVGGLDHFYCLFIGNDYPN